jgi:outer membrane biosynthesis protein TonB
LNVARKNNKNAVGPFSMSKELLAPLGLALAALLIAEGPSFAFSQSVRDNAPGQCGGLFAFYCPMAAPRPPEPEAQAEEPPPPPPAPAPKPIKKKKPVKAAAVKQPAAASVNKPVIVPSPPWANERNAGFDAN